MRETIMMFGIILVMTSPILLGVSLLTYYKATQEAKTFNKFSEQDATTWDALWADLRVEACRAN